MSDNWISIKEQRPPENVVIMTRIDDNDGIRNEKSLLLSGNLFWTPSKDMYVYYAPSHWRHLNDAEKVIERKCLEDKANLKESEAKNIRDSAARI